MKKIIGYKPWRNQPEPFDHSQHDKGVVDYFLTHSSGAWKFSAESRELFKGIYGGQALARVDLKGTVPENNDVVEVIGTDGNYPEKVARAIADGKLFGHEEVSIEVPDPGPTTEAPFGPVPVNQAIGIMDREQFFAAIGLLIEEKLGRK